MIAYLVDFILNFLHFLLLFHQLNLSLIPLLCLSVLEYIYFVFHSILQFLVFSSIFPHFLLLCCCLHLKGTVFPLNLVDFRSQHKILILKRGNNFRILIVDIDHRWRNIRRNRLRKQPPMRHTLQIRQLSRFLHQICIAFEGINKKWIIEIIVVIFAMVFIRMWRVIGRIGWVYMEDCVTVEVRDFFKGLWGGEDREDVAWLDVWDCFFYYWAIFEVAVLKLLSTKTHRVNKIIILYKGPNAKSNISKF